MLVIVLNTSWVLSGEWLEHRGGRNQKKNWSSEQEQKKKLQEERDRCKMLMGRQRVPKTQTLQHAEPQNLDPPFLDSPIFLPNGPGTTVKIYLYPLLINDTETTERKHV